KHLAHQLLGKEIKAYADLVKGGQSFLDLPFQEMMKHACQDADVTMRLYPVLLEQLRERGITEQFSGDTLPLVTRFGDLEFEGISVDPGRMEVIRRSLIAKATRLKSRIFREMGKAFDLDSDRELWAVLREALLSKGYLAPGRITTSILEQLAISEPLVQPVVEYKRFRSRILGLDSISAAARGERIYPLFSQTKSRAGLASTVRPNLFDMDSLPELKFCFDGRVHDYFRDRGRALDALAQVTQDPILQGVRASKSKVDPFLTKRRLMRDGDYDEFLLSVVLGHSEAKLSRRFLIDRLNIGTLMRDIEKRYEVTFGWLRDYRRVAQANGYATANGRRKYIDDLRSSDLAQ
ncbi:MAG: hypothetical protein JO015_20140, partial [Verrucomicrobia bacterium]|nr:hypothetical protein [Verrucomicrobiota bacterium]